MVRTLIKILSIICLLQPVIGLAQQYEFGISGGGTGYMGDLNNTDPLYYRNVGGGAFVKYNLNATWGFRGSFNYLSIYANDMDFDNNHQQSRGLMFNNNIKEMSLTAEFNFFKFIAGRQSARHTPYIFAGLAAVNHSPYIHYEDVRYDLRDYPLEVNEMDEYVSLTSWAVAVPIGIGYKYNIRGPWSIGAELNYRTVFSDHIDGVSQYYRDLDVDLEEPIAIMADPAGLLEERGGTLRGDGKRLDGYMTAGITLTYTLISLKCDWWQ